jgi:hypothetical protein
VRPPEERMSPELQAARTGPPKPRTTSSEEEP